MEHNIRKISLLVCILLLGLIGFSSTSLSLYDLLFPIDFPEQINSYKLDIQFDGKNKLICTQKTTYVNNTGQKLDSLFFHVYPNAFKSEKDKTFSGVNTKKAFPNGFSAGKMDIVALTGQAVSGYKLSENEQFIEITLSQPLEPKNSVDLEFAFTVTLPNIRFRFGYLNGVYNAANFYPIACAYDRNGWGNDVYRSYGDPFYSDIANYEVTVTLPAEMKLASTGVKIKSEDNGGLVTHTINAPYVRDFAFCISQKFDVIEEQADETRVLAYYTGQRGKQAVKYAAEAVKLFNRLFCKYEYPELSVVDTNHFLGAMEYPNLVMIDHAASSTDDLEYLVVHEVAHQWWYGVVGSDQSREAWLDEGLAEFSTLLYYRECYGEAKYNERFDKYVKLYDALGGAYENDSSMSRPLKSFKGLSEYQMLSYIKPTIMYYELHREMGHEPFIQALRIYYDSRKYMNATPDDLIAAFDRATDRLWTDEINKWIYGNGES